MSDLVGNSTPVFSRLGSYTMECTTYSPQKKKKKKKERKEKEEKNLTYSKFLNRKKCAEVSFSHGMAQNDIHSFLCNIYCVSKVTFSFLFRYFNRQMEQCMHNVCNIVNIAGIKQEVF